MACNASSTLTRVTARILATLVLAVMALPLGGAAAGAEDNYTAVERDTSAQAYWRNCTIGDGMHTCTSTWIAVGGIYNNGSIDRGSAKKVCFVYDISSWPAEDVSAQGGGGGAGDLFEYGCPEVPEALQISGLSSATLSSVTVPLYTVAQDCAYDCWTFSRNVTLAARFQATGEVNRSSYFSWHEWIDGCMRTDNGIDEWRQASVDLTVDGKQMPIHGLLGSYIAHGQFTYSQACM